MYTEQDLKEAWTHLMGLLEEKDRVLERDRFYDTSSKLRKEIDLAYNKFREINSKVIVHLNLPGS